MVPLLKEEEMGSETVGAHLGFLTKPLWHLPFPSALPLRCASSKFAAAAQVCGCIHPPMAGTATTVGGGSEKAEDPSLSTFCGALCVGCPSSPTAETASGKGLSDARISTKMQG